MLQFTSALRVGTDLVHIPTFERKLKKRGGILTKRMFSSRELHERDIDSSTLSDRVETLAGMFAAKEAFIKTLDKNTVYQVNRIEVLKENNNPYILFAGKQYRAVSISHDHDYAIAIVLK